MTMKRGCWAMLATATITAPLLAAPPADPAGLVNPFIGTTNGGNEFPGAVLPFGMVSFSPEETPLPGSGLVVAAPGGYEWRSNGVRGFGLAHVSGSGCAGAGGDIPIMPVTRSVETSPSAPGGGNLYAAYLDHAKEQASPGAYSARLGNGVAVDLSATLRTGVARFAFPEDKPANLLFRTSDTEVGSSDATIHIDAAHRTVSGTVTSGNFCGYLSPDRRQSYYTLHFVAVFDRDFKVGGTWIDGDVHAGATDAKGGTGYGSDGFPVPGKGSGGWISFDAGAPVTMRVGISYVDEAGARANLTRESPAGTGLDATRTAARAAWNRELGRIAIEGGTDDERTVFTTALYHSLIDPSIASDVDGRYRGMDGAIHRLGGRQQAQYANFSGWDVYRSQLQLVTMLDPKIGSDIAQSLLNQADQNGGVWDRWTHMTGATGVMNGDPSAPAIAAIYAFGGREFDVRRAYASLLKAATVPNAKDLSRTGCPVLCVGQRPGLDQWLSLHYMPAGAPGWGSCPTRWRWPRRTSASRSSPECSATSPTSAAFSIVPAGGAISSIRPRATSSRAVRTGAGCPSIPPPTTSSSRAAAHNIAGWCRSTRPGCSPRSAAATRRWPRSTASFTMTRETGRLPSRGRSMPSWTTNPRSPHPGSTISRARRGRRKGRCARRCGGSGPTAPTAFPAMTISARCRPGTSGRRWGCIRSIRGAPIWWWAARCSATSASTGPAARSISSATGRRAMLPMSMR